MTNITGTNNADVLDNGAGPGTMTGLQGNDTYIVDNSNDVIVEAANSGDDDVQASCSYILPENVEYLYLTGLTQDNFGTGNSLNNYIFGQQGPFNSTLDGKGGDDHLYILGGGNDTSIGGTGNDTMQGGYGNDTYVFRAGDGMDLIIEQHGDDRIVFDSSVSAAGVSYIQNGIDLVVRYGDGDEVTIATYFRPQFDPNDPNEPRYQVESVHFADGTVHDTNYILAHLNEIHDLPPTPLHLDGGNGADILTGAGGNDVISGGNGNDSLSGLGGDDTLSGGNGSDRLDGGDGNDNIYGGNGNDLITGGGGSDNLWGGNGSDTFVFSPMGDNAPDTLKDFDAHNDTIDIKALLTGYDPLVNAIGDFVQLSVSGGNTVISVDADGAGGGASFAQVAILEGVTNLPDVNTLIQHGTLIIH